MPKRFLECTEIKGKSAMCINDEIYKFEPNSIPENFVVLFETDPGWNQHGGKELLRFRHIRNRVTIIGTKNNRSAKRINEISNFVWNCDPNVH
jgi:hypothetical protein